jgi:hypothetical protein
MWVSLVEISAALGKILRTHYSVNGPKPTVDDINNSAEEVRSCRPPNLLVYDSSDLIRLHSYHIELFYEYVWPDAQPASYCEY